MNELKEENHDTGVIYMVTNIENNKKYIGQSFSYISKKKIKRSYESEIVE